MKKSSIIPEKIQFLCRQAKALPKLCEGMRSTWSRDDLLAHFKCYANLATLHFENMLATLRAIQNECDGYPDYLKQRCQKVEQELNKLEQECVSVN